MKNIILKFLILITFCYCVPQGKTQELKDEKSIFGKYTDGYTSVLEIKQEYNKLFIEPSFERGIFVVDTSDFENLSVTEIFENKKELLKFEKDENGKIEGLHWKGKFFPKKKNSNATAVEFLLDGRRENGVKLYMDNKVNFDVKELSEIAVYTLNNLPSKSNAAAGLLEVITQISLKDTSSFYHLGRAYMRLNKRKLAKKAFQRAIELGADNKDFIAGYITEIDSDQKCSKYPNIDFNKLFLPPSSSEIENIKLQWKSRNLNPESYKVELETPYTDKGITGTLQILSYKLNSKKNYGAIFIPNGKKNLKLPVIVEAKGINWRYSGLNVSYRPKVAPYLKEQANNFIYIVPAFKGEKMTYANHSFIGDGMPNDGWDGATDDYLTFLNVAIKHLDKKIDTSKIIAFGDSRGGAVAMLAAIRDSRIKSVVNWAGPVDWLQHMNGYSGLTLQGQIIDGINRNIQPQSGTPGQFIDWYFHKKAKITQDEIRFKMIASSPIYFIDELPRNILLHYGREDFQVPIINGFTLADQLNKQKEKDRNFKCFFHENIGHNLNPYEAITETRKFIIEATFEKGNP